MSTQVRTSNQSRASTKIVLGFVVLLAIGYFGKNWYAGRQLDGVVFTPLTPGRVNLVGVDTQKGGYHIIVANGIAQLVQSAGGAFGPGNMDSSGADSGDSDAEKKRVPLKELLQILQGKGEAAGRFVAKLNDMKDEDLPPESIRVDWKVEDLQRAIKGDAALRKKLEQDLNTHLDGTPLPEFRPSTFQNGIVIDLPISLNVPTAQGTKPVAGTLLVPFQSALMKSLEVKVSGESNLDKNKLAGYYSEIGQDYIDKPNRRQNIADALTSLTSGENVNRMTELPQTVMDSIQIIATDSQITHASYTSEDADKGKQFNMSIDVSDEGRKRLWQYSRGHLNDQVLLVVDGVAVAAPRIGTELAASNFDIKNMPDESIVKDATDKINSK